MPKFIIAAMLIGISIDVAAQITGPIPPQIRVRSHNFSVSEREFSAARGLVETTLGQAGIAVSWLPCWSGDPSAETPADCKQPLRANEVILRVVGAPRPSVKVAVAAGLDPLKERTVLGVSVVDLQAASGSLATVYSDRVRDLSRGTGVDNFDLLARAIAHEIGHLLLGTNQHPPSGLMRPAWSRAEVHRNQEVDWRFSDAEGQTMRKTLEARCMEDATQLEP